MHTSMSIEISFDIRRCCRACLAMASTDNQDEYVELLESFHHSSGKETTERRLTVLECFNECTRLEIKQEQVQHRKPTAGEYAECRYLCYSCLEELRQAYEFITKARLSDLVLKEHILQLKTEVDEQSEEDELSKEGTLLDALEESVADEEKQIIGVPQSVQRVEYVTQQVQLERELAAIFGQDVQDNACDLAAQIIETNAEEIVEAEESNKENADTVISVECLSNDVEAGEEIVAENMVGNGKEEVTDILVKFVHSDSEDDEEESRNFFEFKCEFCTAKFDYQSDLLQHYEKDHDDKNLHFPCEFCEGRFVTKNALRLHKRQIHQKCEYLDCPQCGRTVLKSFYGIHLKRHSKQLKLLCSKCPNTFTSKYTLKKHMELHSDTRDRNVECLDCGRKFFTLESLQLHQATHQDRFERVTYECTVCAKTFVRKSNLKLHMQLHRGETMDCQHCGKKFVRRKDLEIHIRFHTGDFPYVCTVCGKKFAIKGHLNYHEKRHSGLRYKCSYCDKTFINLAGLRQHSFEHTGMPLECNICLRGFPTKFKMRRHIRSVHHQIFEEVGYSDELAERCIKQRVVPKADIKRELVKNTCYDDMETVEMLSEHEDDITYDRKN